jgi:ATP-dependent RNA helicase RhlE
LQRLAESARPEKGRRRPTRTLVLAPTRELAVQIDASFRAYGRHSGLRSTVVYGGVSQVPQVKALNAGVDILIATPGRLLDLMQQGYVDLGSVEVLILDEADRMFDMGFVQDLKRIVAKVPRERQTLMFSATMPSAIKELANAWLKNPVDVSVAPVSSTAERIEQSVFMVDHGKKLPLLVHWLRETAWTRTLVFTRTKHGADKVVRSLAKAGITADAFHGNKSQNARQRTLLRFKTAQSAVLVATDIAARGLDIDQISHVVNYDLPVDAESYVHRIGRTGRAEASGVAISFCSRDERSLLKSIERLTKRSLAIEGHPAGLQLESVAVKTPGSTRERHAEERQESSERSSQRRRTSGAPHPVGSKPTGSTRFSGRTAVRRAQKNRLG